jgi:hypothetical protein
VIEPVAALISILIEAPIVLGAVRVVGLPARSSWLRVAVWSVLTTAITHPILWYALDWTYPWPDYWTQFGLAETGVVLVEGALYAWPGRLGWRYGMAVSLAANGASAGFGVILMVLQGN